MEQLNHAAGEDLWYLGQNVPETIQDCIHRVVGITAAAYPEKTAVHAWDGDLTYAELNELSTQLACHLINFGVGPEVIVPLCFEKSMWTVVCMLAVLKAGGAFTLLDVGLPKARLHSIVIQCGAKFVCASSSNSHIFSELPIDTIIVGQDSRSEWPTGGAITSDSEPSSSMYLCFTSGSTGQPKGIVVPHSSFCSAVHYQAETLGFDKNSRTFDFASYSVDVSIFNTMATLSLGGCLCVPSQNDRTGRLNEAMSSMEASIVILTPTIARLLRPEMLSSLQTLVLLGEAASRLDLEQWQGKISRILNTYGPTECTTLSTINCTAGSPDDATNIGKAAGAVSWIVDPENHERLVPFGEIGELLLEGPILAREYLGEVEKTSAVFIQDPAWLVQGASGHPGRRGRLYKTGDLVRYNKDGSLTIVGRKDTQVKIRGQRLELGEVEYHVRECLPTGCHVVAEMIEPGAQKEKAMLAIFLTIDEQSDQRHSSALQSIAQLGPDLDLLHIQEEILTALSQQLPVYMVPSLYFLMTSMPQTASGKTNRKQLRSLGSALSAQQLVSLQTGGDGEKRQPRNAEERLLRDLWCSVLGLSVENIGIDDDFFRLGGDSVSAMKLVAEAHKASRVLTVEKVFQHPVLVDQAAILTITNIVGVEEIPPFSLIEGDTNTEALLQDLSSLCKIDASVIEDSYPCTSLQQGLMSLTAKGEGEYVLRAVLDLSDDVQMQHFQAAWEDVVRSNAILRTRIVQHHQFGLLQVVCRENVEWIEASDLDQYLKSDKILAMGLGDALQRFALVTDVENKTRRFVWTVHHALYDGWSLPQLLNLVNDSYWGRVTGNPVGDMRGKRSDFNAFVKYLVQRKEIDSESYWQSDLANGEFVQFPTLPVSVQKPVADEHLELEVASKPKQGVTMSNMIRAALAILISEYTGSEDVIFGSTVSGRNAPVTGIDQIIGPTIATIPIRLHARKEQSVLNFLDMVQRQAIDMIAHEQTGLQRIAGMSDDGRNACDFQTLLVIQPQESDFEGDNTFGSWETSSSQQTIATYALTLECLQKVGGIKFRATYDPAVMDKWKVEKMLQHLGTILSQLANSQPGQTIKHVHTLTSEDQEQIWGWNQQAPPFVEDCVHHLIGKQVSERPDAPAVAAWDGKLTYRQLDDLSTRLAGYLVGCGIGPEKIVPICFEKSMWTVVAVYAVHKAGGAFVLLEPSLPEARMKKICGQVDAKVAITSASCEQRLSSLVSQTIVLQQELINSLTATLPKTTVAPSNTAYVIFTSGSTGEPKGCIIEHRNYCSVVAGHSNMMNMSQDTRALQFGSYNFAGAIMEILMTLSCGGCVCVPSEEERGTKLELAIRRMDANWAFVTSNVLARIRPENALSLRTVNVGGEPIRSAQIKEWAPKVQLRQTYGSSETAAVISSARLTEFSAATSVGKATAGRYWIIDPGNSDRLMPVGIPGEVLLEGPSAARGYIGDSEKTAQAFIAAPAWRASFGPCEAESRFYRMGDLASYKSDGSLELLGRRDNQVKLRGQRIEVGEIEYQARLATPELKDVAVELAIMDNGSAKESQLIGFLVLDGVYNKENEIISQPDKRTSAIIHAVRARLETALPHWMVPSVLVPTSKLPLTPSGKMDRRRLREIGSSLSPKQIAEIRAAVQGEKRAPKTEIESRLRDIWAQILNIDPESIGMDESFFYIGGDSITAMQVSATARGSIGNISTADILQKRTIARLAAGISASSDLIVTDFVAKVEDDHELFQLSPVQELYVQLESDPTRCYDQGFFLKLRSSVSLPAITRAVEQIVSRHSILRARFSKGEKGWEQRITDDVSGSFTISQVQCTQPGDTDELDAIRNARGAIDIERGPILSAVVANNPQFQSLFITFHHLFVDLVSWRVLLHELEELLTIGDISIAPAVSFQAWCRMQAKYAAECLKHDISSFYQAKPPFHSYWDMDVGTNLQGGVAKKLVMLDRPTTTALLGSCNEAFGTRPTELMISALIHSFQQIFQDRQVPDIFTEGHGREPWDDTIDISRTVGWFTTIFPIQVPSEAAASLLDTIRHVKDFNRRLPMNGWSDFTSKFADRENAKRNVANFPAEILFNFAGSYQQLERKESLFQNMPIPEGCDPPDAAELTRFGLFDFFGHNDNGCFTMTVEYPGAARHQEKIVAWIDLFQQTLEQFATILRNRTSEWTIADFPAVFNSYKDIEEFRTRTLPQVNVTELAEIEDIYPCTPMQEGILISQNKDSRIYHSVFGIEITTKESKPIDAAKIEQAWKAVVRRHPLLRAVLVDTVPSSTSTMNIILRDPNPNISVYKGDDSIRTAHERLNGLLPPSYQKEGLQHHLTVFQHSESQVYLTLEINHVISDGHSVFGILMQDLGLALDNRLDQSRPSFGEYAKHIADQSQDVSREFWIKRLEHVDPCIMPASKGIKKEDNILRIPIDNIDSEKVQKFCAEWEVTTATIIHAAWALVLQQYTGSNTPCFGVITSGRDIPVDDVNNLFGPLISIIPLRVQLDDGHSVVETLQKIHGEYIDSLPHQMFPLMELYRALQVGSTGLFNSIVSSHKAEENHGDADGEHTIRIEDGPDLSEFDVSITVLDGKRNLRVSLEFKANFIRSSLANHIASAFGAAVNSIINNAHTNPLQLSLVSAEAKEKIWEWNATVPQADDTNVHDLIRLQAQLQPDAPAVCSWDGEFTHSQLDELSTRLACYLVGLGIGPECIVPLCFEKSMWTIVAMLGVLKAGGAFLSLNPEEATSRREFILNQVQPRIVLTSSPHQNMSLIHGCTRIIVSCDSLASLPMADVNLPSLISKPDSMAYVIYTSGSTGQPKGVVQEHRAVSSVCRGLGTRFGYSGQSRVLQFSSYTFDVSIAEILATLTHGGCICVPSEQDRLSDLVGAMNTMSVNMALLTSTVARMIQPDEVPTLKCLVLTGEAAAQSDYDHWDKLPYLFNGYGPTETNFCTTCAYTKLETHPENIGTAIGCTSWVVDRWNHNRLLPLGAIGELVLEGPIVAREYLNNPEKTVESFIENPSWLSDGANSCEGRRGRLYKTGDLVFYNEDGSLSLLGRKDSQVKLRGQRLELGEVEHHVSKCISFAKQVVADVIIPGRQKDKAALVVFLTASDEDISIYDSFRFSADAELIHLPSEVEATLSQRLPVYMLPTLYLRLAKLPLTASGKTNRRQLQEIGSTISPEQLVELQVVTQGTKRQVQTVEERQLRDIWAEILRIDPSQIGLDDNFFRLGGDSVSAMKLVAQARNIGVSLTVSGIFKHPILAAQATVHTNGVTAAKNIEPFSLLGADTIAQNIHQDLTALLGIEPSIIEDAYPCTPLQEGLLSLTAKRSGDYVLRAILELSDDIQPTALKAAWGEVVRAIPILRTRIVHHSQLGFLQVVCKQDIDWREAYSLQEYVTKDREEPMNLGDRLCRLALLPSSGGESQKLVWTMHHALYDGETFSHIMSMVIESYQSKLTDQVVDSAMKNRVGFNAFVKHVAGGNNVESEAYWRTYLSNGDYSPFPSLPAGVQQPLGNETVEFKFPFRAELDVTTSTLIRGALAILLSQYSGAADVLFGAVVSGRNAPVVGIEDIIGPTIATVPIRAQVHKDQTVHEFLNTLQKEATDMIPFEQTGLQGISKIGEDCRNACEFQTLLVVQPLEGDQGVTTSLGKWRALSTRGAFTTYAVTLECLLGTEEIVLRGSFDTDVVDKWRMEKMMQQLISIIGQLAHAPRDQTVENIQVATVQDKSTIWQWNKEVPAPVDKCLHHLVAEQVQTRSDAPAVVAFDGELTYKELDRLTTKLAAHLVRNGISPEKIVPIIFEKSQWAVVAMLAVLKSGGAFVPLDPSQGADRRQYILHHTNSRIALTSSFYSDVSLAPECTRFVVDNEFMANLPETNCDELPSLAQPGSTAYILFTSGSTGQPKGVVVEHRAVSTSCVNHGAWLGFNPESRMLQFSSFTFDGCIAEIFTTLIHGGCICMPSDKARLADLPGAMKMMDVTIAFMTPTVSRMIQFAHLPSLRTLIIGGEVTKPSDCEAWDGICDLVLAYGPTEAAIFSGLGTWVKNKTRPDNIGTAVGCVNWVVDRWNHNQLAPLGSVGELLLEGHDLAREYLKEAEKTATSFIIDPVWLLDGNDSQVGRHGRLYKTGDLVQYNKDGSLSFIGRKDMQVKIRGQRLELGEVEHHVRECMPSVAEAIAEVIKPDGNNEKAILAIFLSYNGKANSKDILYESKQVAGELRLVRVQAEVEGGLSQRLPSYMIPSVYLRVAEMPQMTSGKTDRRRLIKMATALTSQRLVDLRRESEGEKRQPHTDVQRKLRDLWAKILSINSDTIGLDDSFIELGGDSIAAMKVAAEARKIGLDLAVADIFRRPRLYQMVNQDLTLSTAASSDIKHKKYSGPVSQSFAQGRLWFLDRLYPGLTWYVMPIAVRLRGPLRLDALGAALLAVEERHESLRTTFMSKDGLDLQVVHPFEPKKLKIVDLAESEVVSVLEKEQTTGFDLETEAGWKVTIYRLNENDHVLSIVMHHIIADGWSVDILRKELEELYTAAIQGEDLSSVLKPLPIQYRDYSVWQREENQANEDKQLDYWIEQLETSQPAEILCDKPRPTALSGSAAVEELRIDDSLYNAITQFGKIHQVTPFVVLLAAFRATHYRLTGINDATIGSPNANRNRWELENLIGFFVNMQCVRIKIEEETSFADLVAQVNLTVTTGFANQDIPFEKIVSKLQKGRDLSRHPLVQVVFAVHAQQDLGQFNFEGTKAELMAFSESSRFDLECHFFPDEQGLRGEVMYSTDLYEPATIKSMLSIFHGVLKQGLETPAAQVALFPLLTDDAYAELDQMGILQVERTDYPRDSSLVEVFRAQVANCPDKVAVKDSSTSLTYAELENMSNQLARWLACRSFASESLVAVFAARSCLAIVTLLGILKAGLAYVPLDVKTPAGRMESILSSIDGRRLVLVGPDQQPPSIGLEDVEYVRIEDALSQASSLEQEESNDVALPSATSLAYVMFTSGSTGKPKGVMVEHRGIMRLVTSSNTLSQLPVSPIMAHISNIAFDASTWEIYVPLLNGGTVICMDAMAVLDYTLMEETIIREQVQTAFITPALFKQYLTECPSMLGMLETLMVGGERIDPQDIFTARSLVKRNVMNAYGPTENTIFSTFYCIPESETFPNGVPIGRAISNSGAYVMDSQLRLVPLGVVGELIVTGDGLARGYTDSKLNSNRFVSLEIQGKITKAYRTGDYVRHRPTDGQLEFFGRMDGQVKIKGHRIELGEIEHALRNQSAVNDAVVVLQNHQNRHAQIIGFVTIRDVDVSAVDGEEDDNDEAKHVDEWQDLIFGHEYKATENVDASAIGRDFIGWISMYDGAEIDKGEMNEWLDDTIASIRNGGEPGRVLEIGTGTGMILFNLIDGLEDYVGLEPSGQAVEYVMQTAKSLPGLGEKVHMFQATATDFGKLETRPTPNLLVVNSVAQYFPSQEYLFRVIEEVAQLDGMQTMFFGDMRSFALYKQFQATKALFLLGDRASKDEYRQRFAEIEQAEMELLVDPAFFTALTERLPHLIDHVEILPKRMHASNELSCYRYAAVVHVKRPGVESKKVHDIEEGEWIDFMEQNLDRQSLLTQLTSSSPTIAISNIPYEKTIVERFVLESLNNKAERLLDSEWISSARQKAQSCPSFAAIDLAELAQQSGYRVEISWARQFSQHGGLDAVFHRYEPSTKGERVLFQFPTEDTSSLRTLSSQPLRQRLKQKIQDQLHEKIRAKLPAYMVPQSIKILDEMPINANGKVDRRALADSVQVPVAPQGAKRQPTTDTERQVQRIWAQILSIEATTIGLDDSFFQLGGDSIAAMKVVGEARRIGIKLAVADIFRQPKLHQMANHDVCVDEAARDIPQTEYTGPVQQSFAQGRLWFLDQLYPGLTWYLMPCIVRFRGAIRLDALSSALQAIENRHETLRTTFSSNEGIDLQTILPFRPKDLRVIELPDDKESLSAMLQQDQKTTFNLESEAGWRVTLYRIGAEDHVLSIIMHHIISDGWSVDVLRKELGLFYSAALQSKDPMSIMKPLPIQYRDYSVWQRNDSQADEDKQLEYWMQQLETSQPAELFCDRPRPATLSGEAAWEDLRIEKSLYTKLQQFCKDQEVTPFIVLLAAFRAAHYRLTGSIDATVGTVNANRNRWELKDMIGFFINMQCVRIKVEDESFASLVKQVHATTTEGFANQDVPFEKIVSKLRKDRDLSRHPLVQVVFALNSQLDLGQFNLEGVETEQLTPSITSRFDLEFHFFQEQNALYGGVMYSTDLYDRKTIRNMLSVFYTVLEQGLADPMAKIALFPLLTDSAYSELEEMGLVHIERTSYPKQASLVDVFRLQVASCPNTVAVKDETTQMTYAQLDKDSERLAMWLVNQCLPAEALVGVFSSRSCETIVAFLAVLKANLSYVPLDSKIPAGRMESIVSAFQTRKLVLVGNCAHVPSIDMDDLEFVRIQDALDQTSQSTSKLNTPPSSSSLAYVMFTSGSTGKPKGVMVEHEAILRVVKDSNIMQHLTANGAMAHITNIAFDVSAWEIYGALLNGGTLVCIDTLTVLDYEELARVFAKENIQSAIFTPALFKLCLLECPSTIGQLDTLLVAGDKVDPQDVSAARAFIRGSFINAYGPTENTIFSTYYCLPNNERCANGVPIGRAISNSGAHVMDSKMRLVPLGVIGELIVTGEGLARGYINPEQNTDRFIYVDIGGSSVRAYRTGDYVRYRPSDGQLEFFGRIDGQVKVRGHRIELGEIEHVLRTNNSAVNDAVVLLQQQQGRDPQIVGFVTIPESAMREAAEEQPTGDDENKHVEEWQDLIFGHAYTATDDLEASTIGRDFIGWISMYDGAEIDKEEMNEWLDETIVAIRNGCDPGSVLELGTGTGMILFNLIDGLQSYIGLEPSGQAVDFVMQTSKSIPALANKVHMYKATATDIGQLDKSPTPDLIVVNSVAQYFPSRDYLTRVIEEVLELKSLKTIFFGDVRSHALYEQFQVTKTMHLIGDMATKEEYSRRMADIKQSEMELLVDPTFFTALASRLPHLIAHVEILPKKMKATNELSCYRYAAVIHTKRSDDVVRDQVYEINENEWVDFMAHNLDSESLLQMLQRSSSSSVVAVGNIPYEKTIVERHVIDALNNKNGSLYDHDWVISARKKAQSCPSLSAVDLVTIAEQAGYRVELSWARQHSLRGGIDAVFHQYKPINDGGRVLFNFPTEDHSRPAQSLASQPLRQRLKVKIADELRESVMERLPAYMVPQTIKILEKMPINANGKVDRKALTESISTQMVAQGPKRQPTKEIEQQMQKLWAQVLNIDASIIGLDDSFFQLGGDSIAAMKLVGATRKAKISLTVSDIFKLPTLVAISGLQGQEDFQIEESKAPEPFSLISEAVKNSVMESATEFVDASSIADIFPITSFQSLNIEESLKFPFQSFNYFFIDFGLGLDAERLEKSCDTLTENFLSLRSCFVPAQGKYWQIVMQKLSISMIVNETTEDPVQVAEQFCFNDRNEGFQPGQSPTKFVLIRNKSKGSRLILRLSHNQYDGVSMPALINTLRDLYIGKTISLGPDFSVYRAYCTRRENISISHWGDLLHGSNLTELASSIASLETSPVPKSNTPETIVLEQVVNLPHLPDGISLASVISSAWAVVLSDLTGQQDVVYGSLVNGRNAAILGIEDIVGPCINIVPVRAQLQAAQTCHELLSSIHQQHLSLGEADSLGLESIIENCTNWPAGASFDSILQHQNLDENPQFDLPGNITRLDWYKHPNQVLPPVLYVISYPIGRHVRMRIMTNANLMTTKVARDMLNSLCSTIVALLVDSHEPLPGRT